MHGELTSRGYIRRADDLTIQANFRINQIHHEIQLNHPFHLKYHSSTTPIAANMTITIIKPEGFCIPGSPPTFIPNKPAIRLKGSVIAETIVNMRRRFSTWELCSSWYVSERPFTLASRR